jgi:hypothetical protein
MSLKIIQNFGYERIWKEAAVPHLKLLSQSMPEDIQGKRGNKNFYVGHPTVMTVHGLITTNSYSSFRVWFGLTLHVLD